MVNRWRVRESKEVEIVKPDLVFSAAIIEAGCELDKHNLNQEYQTSTEYNAERLLTVDLEPF